MNLFMRNECLKTIKQRYVKASKAERGLILNEYCRNTNQNRKYVIRKLSPKVSLVKKQRKARQKVYHNQTIAELIRIWEVLDYPCGQRLKLVLGQMVEKLKALGEINPSNETITQLFKISSATIDRRLGHEKEYLHRKRFTTTKPGSLLKAQIPIRLTDWDLSLIGFVEVDLVAHCGDNVFGDYVNTFDLTDIASGWSEQAAVWGKGQRNVFMALLSLRKRTPFTWLGLDSDNGSEFINIHLFNYCQKENIEFTRARPNRKNDNAYIEQKNWTHVRKLVGYQRLETIKQLKALNDLYANELRLYKNFFCPTMKLISKERIGSKIIKKRESAKTPYQRLMESSQITLEVKVQLKATYDRLNPVKLKQIIDLKLSQIKSNNFSLKCNPKNEMLLVTKYVI